jgi:hypothetical protein
LDEAPIDDKPAMPDEDAGAEEALAEYQRGESYPADEVKLELS